MRLKPHLAKTLGGSVLAGLLFAGLPSTASTARAADTLTAGGATATTILPATVTLSVEWTLIASFLVMFMMAGFALVETGLCRAKNAAHTTFVTLMSFVFAATGFWICGFALMQGGAPAPALGGTPGLEAAREVSILLLGKTFGLFATKGFFLTGLQNAGVFALFFAQVVLLAVAVTIPTGAMAERWTLKGFYIYACFVSVLLYPLFGNWAWGGGWLANLGANFGLGHGYVDFAGSGVVHALGGLCGLAGAMVLGPRIGKFGKGGRINPMPAHHIPMALAGCIILAIGWFGFTTGRAALASGGDLDRIGIIAVVTLLGGAGGALASWAYTLFIGGKPDPTLVGNGLLAGLVGISASAGFVGSGAGFLIGAVAGLLVCWSVNLCDKFQVDDPVGAISIHGASGLWGVLAVGIFADGTAAYGGSWNGVDGPVKGCLHGDWGQLGAQLIGCGTLAVWAFGVSWVFWRIVDEFVGLRVLPEVEIQGLDVSETGVLGYPTFHTGGKE